MADGAGQQGEMRELLGSSPLRAESDSAKGKVPASSWFWGSCRGQTAG